ncbi:MAG TPA: peptidase S15, partial [Candidatus Limnocylindria bacterium]|nr:peptidase S15 [Candidatus Limnocylindria bacterium]
DVDSRIPTAVPLSCAQGVIDYRPIDVAPRVRGLMIVAVDEDAVTPTDHAKALYDKCAMPKKLVMQRGTTHYAAYKQYASEVIPMMVEWLRQLVVEAERPTHAAEEVIVGDAQSAERTPA